MTVQETTEFLESRGYVPRGISNTHVKRAELRINAIKFIRNIPANAYPLTLAKHYLALWYIRHPEVYLTTKEDIDNALAPVLADLPLRVQSALWAFVDKDVLIQDYPDEENPERHKAAYSKDTGVVSTENAVSDTINTRPVNLANYYTREEIDGINVSIAAETRLAIESRVVANPSDNAVGDLEKLKVGSNTFNIPSSGGNGNVDLSNYYTEAETDDAISTAIDAIPPTNLQNYYTKAEIDAAISTAIAAIPSGGSGGSSPIIRQEYNAAVTTYTGTVTGIVLESITITPMSANSKFHITAHLDSNSYRGITKRQYIALLRGSDLLTERRYEIATDPSATSGSDNYNASMDIEWLDEPNTTSPVSYHLRYRKIANFTAEVSKRQIIVVEYV